MVRGPGAGVRGILLTDVVGSSELRSRLGDDRADELRRAHDALLGSAVAAHGGEVLRWTGDGLKASYPTASAAVASAVDMQRAARRYSARPDAVAELQLRVGVSVGEVTFEDDDDHGVAVIEAARLEALAEPGEILATDLVQRLGARRGEADYEEVGTRELKGLEEAVQVVRVVDRAGEHASRPLPRALRSNARFPLVGRTDELAAALRCWNEVKTAGGTVTLLAAGQPGIGKSRFVAQVADRANTDGAIVLAGTCDADLAVPYQPFAMAFTELAAADDELRAAVDAGDGPLGALFPTRRAVQRDDGPAARFELFESVVALVDRLGREHPVVLVLEDLHWAAPPTVQLLRHLVRDAPRASLLVLGSYRPEAVGPGHPLQDLLADGHGESSVSKLELTALSAAAVAELVAVRVPSTPTESAVDVFARRVFAESGGSPFFVCELLDHLAATGQLDRLVGRDADGDLPIPDSVRDVVGQRLARLPEDAGRLLATAAVIGLTFDLELLASLAGGDEEQVLEVLEEVCRVALAREVDAGRFSFDHAIVRATILDRMSASRQALTHRRIAEALEALRRADPDELAHHWRLAGVQDKAMAALELAGQRDLEALAYESAADRYLEVLTYHRNEPDADRHALARAHLGLGLAMRALGQTAYIPDVEEAGRLARALGDGDLLAAAAIASIWPGTFFHTAGQTQTPLVELCQDALELLGPEDPRRVRVLSTLAAHLTFDDDRERRIALLGEAAALAERLADPELTGTVLIAEFLCLWDPTTFHRRGEVAAELAIAARRCGDVDLTFFAGFLQAVCAIERTQLDEALRLLGTIEHAVVASQNFYFRFLVDRLRVSIDLYRCRANMQAEIDALAARYEDTHADTGGTWSLQTGLLTFQGGTLTSLLPAMREMAQTSDIAVNWQAPYGLALLHAGHRDEAMEVLDRFGDPPLDFFWLTTTQGFAELAVGLGRADEVDRLYDTLLPHQGQMGMTSSGAMLLGLVDFSLGQLALARGDHEQAQRLLDRAVATADDMRAPFEATRARRLLAAARLAGGTPPDQVAGLLDEARRSATEHGFDGELAALGIVAART